MKALKDAWEKCGKPKTSTSGEHRKCEHCGWSGEVKITKRGFNGSSIKTWTCQGEKCPDPHHCEPEGL